MEVSSNEYENPTTYIDSDDICIDCKNQYGCPLIECLNLNLVQAFEPFTVKDCKLFEEFCCSDSNQ